MTLYESLRQCIHPVIFETGISDAPLSVCGTGFLLGMQDRAFFVTARHLLSVDNPDPICVVGPRGKVVPLKDVYTFHREVDLPDWADAAVHEVDFARAREITPDLRIVVLHATPPEWKDRAFVSPFVIGGFPREHTSVDYEAQEVVGGYVELQATYAGPASPDGLTHRLHVPKPPPLETFAGFSGSPVFMIHMDVGAPAQYVFCGMLIQGTVGSKSLTFIDRDVFVNMAESKRRKGTSMASGSLGIA